MKSNNNYGFTLLEVLLALSILSIVLLISNYSLKQLTNSKTNLDKKLEFIKNRSFFLIWKKIVKIIKSNISKKRNN